jgi:NitT/TauT family transport system substrate-binding protein
VGSVFYDYENRISHRERIKHGVDSVTPKLKRKSIDLFVASPLVPMTKMPPMRALVLGTAGLLAFFSGCSRQASTDSAVGRTLPLFKVRVQTDWLAQPEQGGVFQALAKGFYRESGLDVEIISGGPGRPVLTGLLADQSDIELSQSDDVILRVKAGLPLVIIGALMEHTPLAVMVHYSSPMRDFADLNGGTVVALPGTTWMSFVKAKYHIDFKLIPIDYSIAAFMADENLIQQCFVTSEPYFVEQAGSHVRALVISDSGYDPYRVYVTTKRFLAEHPDQVRAFVAASVRGWDDFMAGNATPGRLLIQSLNSQMTPAFMDYDIAAIARYHLVSGYYERGERTGLLTSKRLQQQIDQLISLNVMEAGLTVSDVANLDFIPPPPEKAVP